MSCPGGTPTHGADVQENGNHCLKRKAKPRIHVYLDHFGGDGSLELLSLLIVNSTQQFRFLRQVGGAALNEDQPHAPEP